MTIITIYCEFIIMIVTFCVGVVSVLGHIEPTVIVIEKALKLSLIAYNL